MNFFSFVLQDWKSNKNNSKGRFFAMCYRIANYAANKPLLKFLFFPYLFFYKLFFELFLGIEIPYRTIIGKGLIIFHHQAIIINKNTVIGENCMLRHCTTIGNSGNDQRCPIIGNNVNIGANVCIIGAITIGDNVTIGAGAVVVKNVPPSCIVVGNPAKIIKQAS